MLNPTANSTLQSPRGRPMRDAYTLAVEHSARVRRLKILLPIGAVLVSLAFITVSVIRAYLPENITIAGAKVENGQIVMEKPAIAGRNADGINYSMTAERALQDIGNPNMITLQSIKAAVPIDVDTIARVAATQGIFDRLNDRLDMTAPFTVTLDSGMTAKFQSAKLDIKAGTLVSDTAVDIQSNQASILAQSLKMTDKGNLITFEGKVRVNIDSAAIRNKSN